MEFLPLNELAARKRLIQAKMEIHRAEMALYSHEVMQPFDAASSALEKVNSHPVLKYGIMGVLGLFFLSGRGLRRVSGMVLPLLLPRIRSFIANRLMNFVSR